MSEGMSDRSRGWLRWSVWLVPVVVVVLNITAWHYFRYSSAQREISIDGSLASRDVDAVCAVATSYVASLSGNKVDVLSIKVLSPEEVDVWTGPPAFGRVIRVTKTSDGEWRPEQVAFWRDKRYSDPERL